MKTAGLQYRLKYLPLFKLMNIDKVTWLDTEFEDAIRSEIDKCTYCTNDTKYLVLTNLGCKKPVCSLHLLQFGKQRKINV